MIRFSSSRLFRPFTTKALWSKLSMAVLLLGLTSVSILATAKRSNAQTITNINIGTANTQGGGHWQDTILPMMEGLENGRRVRDPLSVLAVQEAGARPPERARLVRYIPCPGVVQGNPQGLGVAQYFLNNGTDRNPVNLNIYFVEWNIGNGRTYLAIVTRNREADRVRVFWPAGARRPTIGVYFADVNTYFWNVHARRNSTQPQDLVGELPNQTHLDAVANNVAGGINWVIMGDWNRPPGEWHNTLPNWGRIIRTGAVTQQSGRELDYIVVRAGGNSHTYHSLATHSSGSDHMGVVATMTVNSLQPN